MFPTLSLILLPLLPAAAAEPGTVELPLSHWESMLDSLASGTRPTPPPVSLLSIDRALDGSFERGVFTGTLTARVVVLDADTRVPVLGADTSIAGVWLDGRPTSLLEEGDLYTVAAPEGVHDLRVAFFSGREDDRFARSLSVVLPPGGPTRLSIQVPESDIEPVLEHGAIAARLAEGGGTRVLGQVDANGAFTLSWKARREAASATTARLTAQVHTLFTLHEALLRGLAVIDATVLEGETDQLVLDVPEGVDVVDVTGESVLQWQPLDAGRISVLLRYLVADRARVLVHFQSQSELGAEVVLRSPVPTEGTPYTGYLGSLRTRSCEVGPGSIRWPGPERPPASVRSAAPGA